MFVNFETYSAIKSHKFKAFIQKIGKLRHLFTYNILKISIKIKRENKTSILFLSTTDDYCQYWKNLQDMTLSSPNYPKQYIADGIGCGWQLSAPKGFIIALEFNHFNVSN